MIVPASELSGVGALPNLPPQEYPGCSLPNPASKMRNYRVSLYLTRRPRDGTRSHWRAILCCTDVVWSTPLKMELVGGNVVYYFMTFYLSSPANQMQSHMLNGMAVLVSYALYAKGMDDYVASFSRILIDSGAFSEFNTGKRVDGEAYKDWQLRWRDVVHVDAVAGLDDISGDWRKSMKNYELYGGFPTMHESDPPELLADLIPIARERGGWLGVGLIPPSAGKWKWVKDTLAQIPDDLHVHVWAGGEYCGHPKVNSTDSTNWVLDSWGYKNKLSFLTTAECVELVVKRYQRAQRRPTPAEPTKTASIWDGIE